MINGGIGAGFGDWCCWDGPARSSPGADDGTGGLAAVGVLVALLDDDDF